MKRASGLGTMASVDLPAEELDLSGTTVTVAVQSSPRSTVVSGDTADVERLAGAITLIVRTA